MVYFKITKSCSIYAFKIGEREEIVERAGEGRREIDLNSAGDSASQSTQKAGACDEQRWEMSWEPVVPSVGRRSHVPLICKHLITTLMSKDVFHIRSIR